jgi:hypothetical protein
MLCKLKEGRCLLQLVTRLCVLAMCAVQVAIGIGDLSWAQQCFRLAAALDPGHAEALNNLGVLQLKRRQPQQVRRLAGNTAHNCLKMKLMRKQVDPNHTGYQNANETGSRCYEWGRSMLAVSCYSKPCCIVC